MAAKSKTYAEYLDLGWSTDLHFMEGDAPASVNEPVMWKCLFCGTVHHKSYRAVHARKHGCTCQNNIMLKDDAYKALAARLEIEWLGNRPKNTKALTQWRNPRTGVVVEASYADLAYGNIRKDRAEQLELNEAF